MGIYDRDYMREDHRRKEQAQAARSSSASGSGKPEPNWVFWRPKRQISRAGHASLWQMLAVWGCIFGVVLLIADHFLLSRRVRALEVELRAVRAAEVVQPQETGDTSPRRIDFFRQPTGQAGR